MDSRAIVENLATVFASSVVAHTAVIEAGITKSPIYDYPVILEPVFCPVDPLQTACVRERPTPARAKTLSSWVAYEVILPPNDEVDLRLATGFITSLAGSNAPWGFEIHARRDQAAVFLLVPQHHATFLKSAWNAAYHDSVLVKTSDPWRLVNKPITALADAYLQGPYHRCLHASTSPWRHFLRLTTDLGADDVLIFQSIVSFRQA